MCDDSNRSVGPGQWAPWISDPDPPEPPMTDEQMTAAARAVKDLVLRVPARSSSNPPPKTLEQIRADLRQHRIKVLMRDYPGMTRARATELVELDFPVRVPEPPPPAKRPRNPLGAWTAEDVEEMREEVIAQHLRDHPNMTRKEVEDEMEAYGF
jgi:hypothetical protein